MPQIDFGHAFTSSAGNEPLPANLAVVVQSAPISRQIYDKTWSQLGLLRQLSRDTWANIAFVALTFLGGLFCMFYFFNGAELLRAAAAWPREFLYPRPPMAEHGQIAGRPGPMGGKRSAAAETDPEGSSNHGPFGRNAGLSAFNQGPTVPTLASPIPPSTTSPGSPPGSPSPGIPGLPGGNPGFPGVPGPPSVPGGNNPPPPPPLPPFSRPPSLLRQLSMLVPGSDALSQAFHRGVAELERLTNLDARRTIVIVTTPIKQARQRATAKIKGAARDADNSLSGATGLPLSQTAQQGSQQVAQQGSQVAGSQVAGAARNAAGTAQTAVTQTAATASQSVPTVSQASVNTVQSARSTVSSVQSQTTSAVRTTTNSVQQTVGGVRSISANAISGVGSVRAPSVRVGGGGRRR